MERNKEGLTWEEWCDISGESPWHINYTRDSYEAWQDGVDPIEWFEARYEESLKDNS